MSWMTGHPQTEKGVSRRRMVVPFVINCNSTVGSITAAPEGYANFGAGVEIAVGIVTGAAATATGSKTGFAYTALSSDTAAVVIGIGVVDPNAHRPIAAYGHVLGDANASLPRGFKTDGSTTPARFACLDPTASTSGVVAPTVTTVGSGGVAFALTFSGTALLTGATAALHCIAYLEWE